MKTGNSDLTKIFRFPLLRPLRQMNIFIWQRIEKLTFRRDGIHVTFMSPVSSAASVSLIVDRCWWVLGTHALIHLHGFMIVSSCTTITFPSLYLLNLKIHKIMPFKTDKDSMFASQCYQLILICSFILSVELLTKVNGNNGSFN